MAKKKASKSFFNDASIKLNREIKAEQQQQGKSKQSGFLKQINDHKTRDSGIYIKAKAEGQQQSLFRGQDVIVKEKRPKPVFNQDMNKLDPIKDKAESPQGEFQFEQRVNLIRKDIK